MRPSIRTCIVILAVAFLSIVLAGQAAGQEPAGAITGHDSPASAGITPLGGNGLLFNGDANCDGTIDSLDALAVLQFNAGLLDTLKHLPGGDPNEDGEVNSTDALLILQFVAGFLPDRSAITCAVVDK